jgi:acetyl esterase/lipase
VHPGILVVHGGGWISNDKQMMMALCKTLARKGFVAAAINYRLLDPRSLRNQWPAQLVDEQLAVRWVKANSRQLRVDSNKICAFGMSAGGHLALFLGLLRKNWIVDRETLYSAQSPAVACVVDICGPTDLSSGSEKVLQLAKLLVQKKGDDSIENALRAASPITFVSPTAAPTLIVQGSNDQFVPKSQGLVLAEVFKKNAAKVQYVEYQGGHVYDGLTSQERAALLEKEIEFMAEALKG